MPKTEVLYGPIQAHDYDTITLVVEHTMFLPDGSQMKVPAGSKLVMTGASSGGGPTVNYDGGWIEKATGQDGAPPPEA